MPEGYTHVRTAHKAAEAIHYKIQCPAAFAAGANGPDSFFCYEVWKKRAKRHYDLPGLGNRMHEEKTGAFLRSLCANVKTRPQVEYALGFLSHYAADTVVHPFIYAMCKPGCPYAGKGGHGYLEIALDSTLHAEDTGSSLVPGEDVSPLPTGAELADVTALLHTCLLETYGEDIPVEYLADAFWHTYRLRGQLDARLPDEWTDPFTGTVRDGGLFALLPRATLRSEQFMGAALLYWMDKLTPAEFAEKLGSMSYTKGIATPESDPETQNLPTEKETIV